MEAKQKAATAGEVTLVVTNAGNLEHNFAIEGVGKTIELILPQDTESLAVKLNPGTYTLIFNLSGHREAGMATQLAVAP